MLSLYLNYLSTVTLIYFANIQYINVASHNQHRWHAVQFDFSLSEQHPLNCILENALGSLALKENQRIQESMDWGASHQLGLNQIRHTCAFYSSLSRCPRQKSCTNGKVKAGRLVTLPFLKGVTLDCCICSLWRLTKCSVCRFAGMMASMTWQRKKMDRCPAGWLGWAPSVVCRLATARHSFHGA